jgi:hypothetical protein
VRNYGCSEPVDELGAEPVPGFSSPGLPESALSTNGIGNQQLCCQLTARTGAMDTQVG